MYLRQFYNINNNNFNNQAIGGRKTYFARGNNRDFQSIKRMYVTGIEPSTTSSSKSFLCDNQNEARTFFHN